MNAMLKKFWKEEDGATAIEYGLIAGLIAIALIATLTTLGGDLDKMFAKVSSAVTKIGVDDGDK